MPNAQTTTCCGRSSGATLETLQTENYVSSEPAPYNVSTVAQGPLSVRERTTRPTQSAPTRVDKTYWKLRALQFYDIAKPTGGDLGHRATERNPPRRCRGHPIMLLQCNRSCRHENTRNGRWRFRSCEHAPRFDEQVQHQGLATHAFELLVRPPLGSDGAPLGDVLRDVMASSRSSLRDCGAFAASNSSGNEHATSPGFFFSMAARAS